MSNVGEDIAPKNIIYSCQTFTVPIDSKINNIPPSPVDYP